MSFWVNVLSGYFKRSFCDGIIFWIPDLCRAAIGAFPEAFGAISWSAFGGAGRERTKATAGSSPGRGRVMTLLWPSPWWQGAASKIVKHNQKHLINKRGLWWIVKLWSTNFFELTHFIMIPRYPWIYNCWPCRLFFPMDTSWRWCQPAQLAVPERPIFCQEKEKASNGGFMSYLGAAKSRHEKSSVLHHLNVCKMM